MPSLLPEWSLASFKNLCPIFLSNSMGITVSISKLLKIKWVKLCEAVKIWHFHQTEKKSKVLITLFDNTDKEATEK